MANFFPPAVTLPEAAPDDPRLGHLLRRKVDQPHDLQVVILGFPSDEGVRINGGRPGAAAAPDHIREALYRLTPDARHHDAFVDLLEHTADLGDMVLDASLEENQEQLGEMVALFLRQGIVPIILGGGHETAFGHFLGYVYAGQEVAIVNWDAHPDVRTLKEGRPHSGSPFRQALTHLSGTCRQYTAAGLQPSATAREHLHFIHAHQGQYIWKDHLTPGRIDDLYADTTFPLMASFDLDAVDQAHAPGVSAPATDGLAPELWYRAAYRAGRSKHVLSMDLVEMNPAHDVDGRTARVAALTVWHFLRGLTERRS